MLYVYWRRVRRRCEFESRLELEFWPQQVIVIRTACSSGSILSIVALLNCLDYSCTGRRESYSASDSGRCFVAVPWQRLSCQTPAMEFLLLIPGPRPSFAASVRRSFRSHSRYCCWCCCWSCRGCYVNWKSVFDVYTVNKELHESISSRYGLSFVTRSWDRRCCLC